MRFRRAKARGTCGTRHAEEGARKKTRLSKPHVSRALHAHLAFPCACLKNAKKLGLFCRQVCTELRMIVTPVDLKGIINITLVKNSTCYFNGQLLLTDCF